MFGDEPDGATPIDRDEAEGLLEPHILTRAQLNAWEQANIVEAARWAERTRRVALDESTIRELHAQMFGRTWNWAGEYRRTDKNIGVPWPRVPEEVRALVDDGAYWFEHGTWPVDEAAARLHHRLVKIHAFPNGNGRHARLWCDLLLRQHGRRPFSWGGQRLDADGAARREYIDALRAADTRDYGPLLQLLLSSRD